MAMEFARNDLRKGAFSEVMIGFSRSRIQFCGNCCVSAYTQNPRPRRSMPRWAANLLYLNITRSLPAAL